MQKSILGKIVLIQNVRAKNCPNERNFVNKNTLVHILLQYCKEKSFIDAAKWQLLICD